MESTETMPDDQSAKARAGRKRLRRIATLFTLLLVVLLLFAPWIVSHTGLRDRLINAIMATPELSATTQSAAFGWFTPLAVEDMQITGQREHFRVELESLTADRSWPMLLASSPDLGTITIEKPHVRLLLPLGERPTRTPLLAPTLTAIVHDAALTVQTAQVDGPVIDVDGIDLTLHIEKSGEQRVLTLDPVEVFTKRDLTPQICDRLLQLINPTLHNATHVQGQYSLVVNELRVPLGIPEDQLVERLTLEGELVLHKVSLEAQGSMLQAVGKILADVYGLEVPQTMRVVKDASVHFCVRDGRLLHEGLHLGLPDIDPALQVETWGSVGLDETLDLHLLVPRLDEVKRTESRPIQCHITGTIHDPRLSVQDASLVVRLPERDEPLIDLHGVDFAMRVEHTPAGRVLAVDPFQVLMREKIDQQLANSLLHLIEPDLWYSPELSGEVSLAFDQLRIPLGVPDEAWAQRLEARGRLVVHEVSTAARDPLRKVIVKLLADLYNRHPEEIVRVSDDTEIEFHLHDGRLHYTGLQFGFPDIDPDLLVTSSGSVGYDESLDLQVELPRLDKAKFAQKGPVRCHVTGTMSNPQLSVTDASLVVRLPDRADPLIDVDGIDLKIHVEDTSAGRVIVVDPVDVLTRQDISSRLTSTLVHLLAPDLRDSPDVSGQVSLTLDKVRVPLDLSQQQWLQQVEVDGRLALHHVTARVQKPVRLALVKLLADLYGKQPSDVVRLAHDTEIKFQFRNGRVHYQDLQLGFPDIDPALLVSCQGSVGLDETLDLHFAVPRLDKTKQAERGPVQCHITGTLSNPRLSARDGSLVVRLDASQPPLLDIDGIDLTMTIETQQDGPTLVFAPVKVLDQAELTSGMGDELLRLIAPTLGDVADVQGHVTLTLDTLRLPVGRTRDQFLTEAQLAGTLQLHEITTTVQTPLLSTLVKVLADHYGKAPPATVRIVKDAELHFELRRGRLFHDKLRFGLPEISPDLTVQTSGSVGLDKSLDLIIDVPRVVTDSAGDPGAAKPGRVRFKITGKLDDPSVLELKE